MKKLIKTKGSLVKNTKVSINQAKLKKLIEIDDLEELYHLLHLLDKKQTEKLILHYKKEKLKDKSKISQIMHKANSKKELEDMVQQQVISNLKEKFIHLAEEIRQERKKGEYVYFEWVKSLSIPLKIKMYEATMDKKDFYKVKKLLDDLERDLNARFSSQEIKDTNKVQY